MAELRIAAMMPDHEEVVFRFLSEHFFPDEPLNNSLNRTVHRENFSLLSFRNGCSLLVHYKGRLVGCALNKILKKDDPGTSHPTDPNGKKIRGIIKLLQDKGDIWRRVNADEVFHIAIVSVSSNCRGMGIGQRLISESCKLAAISGYGFATIECTSHFTKKIAERLDFQPVAEIRYDDYRDESGRIIFNTKKPHNSMVMYIKKL